MNTLPNLINTLRCVEGLELELRALEIYKRDTIELYGVNSFETREAAKACLDAFHRLTIVRSTISATKVLGILDKVA